VWEKMLLHRDHLRELAAVKHNEQDHDADVDGGIWGVLRLIERFLKHTETATSALEALHKDFSGIHVLRHSVEDLEQRIDELKEETAPYSLDYIKSIELELNVCQERMNALETVCNKLIAQLGEGIPTETENSEDPDFLKQFKGIKQELARLKMKFDKLVMPKLKAKSTRKRKVTRRSTGTQSDNVATALKSALRQNGAATASRHTSFAPDVDARRKRRSSPATTFSGRVMNAMQSRIVHIFLGCTLALAIGALLLCLMEDAIPNNWRAQFGPQLEYVRGSPPV
jgi:hypothetical protein